MGFPFVYTLPMFLCPKTIFVDVLNSLFLANNSRVESISLLSVI